MSKWTLFTEEKNIPIDDAMEQVLATQNFGFVYKITRKSDGKFYIGKKQFTMAKRRKPLKGTKRVRLDRVPSKWQRYWGSCRELLEDVERLGESAFTREILSLHRGKWDLTYNELITQLEFGVMNLGVLTYNGIINVRLRRPMVQITKKDAEVILADINEEFGEDMKQ